MADQDQLDDEAWQRTMEQIYTLFIEPELEQRRDAGELPDDFELEKIQVIMGVDRPTEVRFNDETAIMADAEVEPPVEKGEQLELSPDQVHRLRPTAQDPNAAHITMLRAGSGWKVSFDFRYNAERVARHLEAAREFVDTAAMCLDEGRLRCVRFPV